MTFESYMRKLEEKNPSIMRANKIRIKVSSFRAEIERAFWAGVTHGAATSDLARNYKPDLFETLLGGLNKKAEPSRLEKET